MEKVNINGYWLHKEDWDAMNKFMDERRREFARLLLFGDKPIRKEPEESFYFVKLTNGTSNTLGMKSRDDGRIYLLDGYEVNKTKPIEGTEWSYVRDATGFDL
jgi:hypothetical protein